MAAEQLEDSLIISRINLCSDAFKYHQNPKACYSAYLLKQTLFFDIYEKSSIKQGECAKRSSSHQITITIRSDNQKLPVDLGMFWSSSLNKVRLEEYVYKWMVQNIKSDKEIFLEEYMEVSAGNFWLVLKHRSHTSIVIKKKLTTELCFTLMMGLWNMAFNQF